MRKRISVVLILCMLLVSLCMGCDNKQEEGDLVFYLSTDGTSIVPMKKVLDVDSDEEKVEKFLELLSSNPDKVDMMQTIPSDLSVTYSMNAVHVGLDFSKEYYDISATEEVLMRAAIVRTLLQVESVYYVFFTVEGQPLVDNSGQTVGNMGRDFFVENPGQQINSSVESTLTLYFSNEKGTSLVTEERTIKQSTSIPMEKLIMQQLIAGAKESGHLSTIPPTTQLFNVAVSDGVCFVNFDDAFKNQNMEITENIVLYSIVNSLTQMPNVKEVMISINGDTSGMVRFNRKLSVVYTRDLSYLEGEKEQEEPTETESIETEEKEQQEETVESMDTIFGNGFMH